MIIIQISEIKNLDQLTNLERLYLSYNQISEIKNLDQLTNLESLTNLQSLYITIKNQYKTFNYQQLIEYINSHKTIDDILYYSYDQKPVEVKSIIW